MSDGGEAVVADGAIEQMDASLVILDGGGIQRAMGFPLLMRPRREYRIGVMPADIMSFTGRSRRSPPVGEEYIDRDATDHEYRNCEKCCDYKRC